MEVLNTAVDFAVAWLVFGFGLFVGTGALRALCPRRKCLESGGRISQAVAWHWGITQLVYILPLGLAIGLLAVGVARVATFMPF